MPEIVKADAREVHLLGPSPKRLVERHRRLHVPDGVGKDYPTSVKDRRGASVRKR
jgi:hypothetical protein